MGAFFPSRGTGNVHRRRIRLQSNRGIGCFSTLTNAHPVSQSSGQIRRSSFLVDPITIAAIAAAVATVLGALFAGARLIIKELKPNGGNSLRDQMQRIETKISALEHRIDEVLLNR